MRTGSRTILALLLASLFLLSFLPGDTHAIPYKIEGFLKDSGGNPIPQADINISGDIYDPMTQIYTPSSFIRQTNDLGYYVIYLAGNEPGGFPLNSVITISYDSGSSIASTTTTITQNLGSWANLTYDPSGSALASIVISPSNVNMRPSSTVVLTAQGYDQYGEKVSCAPIWKDQSGYGVFTDSLPGSPATVTYHSGEIEVSDAGITATHGTIVGSAKVTVEKSGLADFLFSPIGILVILIIIFAVLLVVFMLTRSEKVDGWDTGDAAAPKRVDRRRRQR